MEKHTTFMIWNVQYSQSENVYKLYFLISRKVLYNIVIWFLLYKKYKSAMNTYISFLPKILPSSEPTPSRSPLSVWIGSLCYMKLLTSSLFSHGSAYRSTLPPFVPLSPSHTVLKSPFYTSVSQFILTVNKFINTIFSVVSFHKYVSIYLFVFLSDFTLYNRLNAHLPHKNWLKLNIFYDEYAIVSVCHIFINSSIDRYLGCFHALAI